jgi:hypothetical protein
MHFATLMGCVVSMIIRCEENEARRKGGGVTNIYMNISKNKDKFMRA